MLPQAEKAVLTLSKLTNYSLSTTHPVGGPKAQGFALILGITVDDAAYLKNEILLGLLIAPISGVRANPPYGVNCVVEVPVRGIGAYNKRVVPVRTIWELSDQQARPRLVSAFPRI